MSKESLPTIEQFLGEVGKAAGYAQAEAVRYLAKLVADGHLDVKVPLGEQLIELDGVSLLPTDLVALSKLVIETEGDVVFKGSPDGKARPAVRFHRGLFNRAARVKVRATFCGQGSLEGIEILRDKANEMLRESLDAAEADLVAGVEAAASEEEE